MWISTHSAGWPRGRELTHASPRRGRLNLAELSVQQEMRAEEQQRLAALRHGSADRLRVLDLRDNAISDSTMLELARLVREGRVPSVQRLRLWGNRFGDGGVGALANALAPGADGAPPCPELELLEFSCPPCSPSSGMLITRSV